MKERVLKAFPVVIYLIAVAFLAYVTEESIALVLLGMMPALIHLFVLLYFDPNHKENHVIVFLSPLVLSTLFLLMWKTGIDPTVTNMDGPTVAFLNVLLGYVMMLFFIRRKPKKIIRTEVKTIIKKRVKEDEEEIKKLRTSIRHYAQQLHAVQRHAKVTEAEMQPLRNAINNYQARIGADQEELRRLREMLTNYELELSTTRQDAEIHKRRTGPLKETIQKYEQRVDADSSELERLRQLVDQYAHELQLTREELGKNLRSIEDKCKAINFAIGRVYADKKGGSKTIREKLKISSDLYNRFSEMIQDDDIENKEFVLILKDIIKKLNQMEHKEKDVVKVKKARVKVDRKVGDSVLTVLDTNDNDPVNDYHAEAKAICKKLIELLNS